MKKGKRSEKTGLNPYIDTVKKADIMKRVAERVINGESELSACQNENIDHRKFRRFVKLDPFRSESCDNESKEIITCDEWLTWEERLLKDLCGFEIAAPENFSKIFDNCCEKVLNTKEKNFLLYRYNQDKTYEEIGLLYGLTRERVRQVINCGLAKLRRPEIKYYLLYGDEYRKAVENLQNAQAEYDRAIVELMKSRFKEGLSKIDNINKKAEEYRKKTAEISEGIVNEEDLSACKENIITSLGLSVRSQNALRANNITTLSDLISLSHNDLASIKNLGKRSVDEIEEKLFDKYKIMLKFA